MTPKDFRCGWCDECQATVWALEMILVEKLPLYKAFRNRPKHLSRGNFTKICSIYRSQLQGRTKNLWAMSSYGVHNRFGPHKEKRREKLIV